MKKNLSKILKNPQKLNIPLLIPENKPLEEEVFKTLIDTPEEKEEKKTKKEEKKDTKMKEKLIMG